VHDRLSPRRQEHPAQELSLPGRARRGASPPPHHGHPRPARDGGGYVVETVRTIIDARRSSAPSAPPMSCSPPGRSDPEAPPRHEGRGHAAHLSERLGELTRTNSEAILGARTFERAPISPAGWPSPRRSTLMTTPTSNRSATARARTPWGCSWPGSSTSRPVSSVRVVGRGAPRSDRHGALSEPAPLVGADHHRPRHADPRQLDHLLHQARSLRATGPHLEAGHGQPNPTWIPGRPRGGPPHGPSHQGDPCGGWNDIFTSDDRPHHRGSGHRRQRPDRRHRPFTTASTGTRDSMSSMAPRCRRTWA